MGTDPTPDSLDCERGLALVARLEEPIRNCAPNNGGADTDFVVFLRGSIEAFPGQRAVRLPIKLTSSLDLEGLTLSVRADPPVLELHEIEFSEAVVQEAASRAWTYTHGASVEDGFLASTVALDLGGSGAKLPALVDEVVAHLIFSVPDDVEVGTRVEIDSNRPRAPMTCLPSRMSL